MTQLYELLQRMSRCSPMKNTPIDTDRNVQVDSHSLPRQTYSAQIPGYTVLYNCG